MTAPDPKRKPDVMMSFVTILSASFLLFAAESLEAETRLLDETELEKFRDPLTVELVNGGLSPSKAKRESDRLLSGLKRCWSSDYNATKTEEQEVQTIILGGSSILTYKTPCLNAFLAAIDETVPGRLSRQPTN